MKRTLFLISVLILGSQICRSQTVQLENGGEIKATTDHALHPIGADGTQLYYLNIGMGRKVADYTLLVYDQSDLKKTVREIDLGKVLADIKAHDVAYYFLQNGKIYLVTISKDLYFGSILASDGKVISANIPLYVPGMTKASVNWAEVVETVDRSHLALVSRKSVRGKMPDEFTLVPFNAEFKSEGVHKFKMPEALGDVSTTDIHYGTNGCLYLAFEHEVRGKGGRAFVYDSKSKSLTEYDLGEQDDDSYYTDGQFHEGPDGSVWLGLTKGPGCVNSYSLFRHRGGDGAPELVETYAFNEALLEKSKVKVLIGKGCPGLPSGTRLQQMVFNADGSMYAIFEGFSLHKKESTNATTGALEVSYTVRYTDLFCVKLNGSGHAQSVGVVYKNQTLYFDPVYLKAWTLGRYRHEYNLRGFALSYSKSLSFYAWSQNGKLEILFNDDDGNGTKNEPYPDVTNNLNKANLIQASVDGEAVSKEILFESDNYELIVLPRMIIPLSNGSSAMTSATSKRGGLTSVYLLDMP